METCWAIRMQGHLSILAKTPADKKKCTLDTRQCKGDALGVILAEAKVELEAKTLVNTLVDVEAGALVDTLADLPVEAKTETFGQKVGILLPREWLTKCQTR